MARTKKFENIAPQMLYIMQNGNTNEYKIGITNDLNTRHPSLQTGCPNALHIIKIWKHTQRPFIQRYERVLHRFFEKVRIRNNGEWFILSDEDISFLCKPTTVAEQNAVIQQILKQA